MTGSKPTDEGQVLWARIKKTVKPLKSRKSDEPEKPVIKTLPPLKKSRANAPLRPAAKLKPSPNKAQHAPPEDRTAQKKVRRGQVEHQAKIDLHGMKHDEARAYLLYRLQGCYHEHLRTVLVITGRGERDEGVLRSSLSGWLNNSEFRVLVSGLAPAHVRHGGKGAWYLFLRKAKPL